MELRVINFIPPIKVAARTKAWVCGRSLVGNVRSNPTRDTGVSFFWVLCYTYTGLSEGHTYRSFATKVSQFKIWHFWVNGIERNACRCTFNRYSVITQFAKLAAGEQLCRCCIENYSTSKPLKVSPEKSQIFSCDSVVQMSDMIL